MAADATPPAGGARADGARTTGDRSTEPEPRATLRAHGLRVTSPRLRVLRHLREAGEPLTHDDVYRALKPRRLDRATVYRVLLDLAEAGVARRFDAGDHLWRYELTTRADDDLHPHFVCRECGTVTCLPVAAVRVAPLDRWLRQPDLEIQVRGLCATCESAAR